MMYLPENSSNGNKMQLLTSPLIILFHTVGVLSTINCPLNETEWKARSYTKNCQGSDAYHCLLLEDGKTREEKCIEKTLIKEGHCPILTHDDYLHWKTCNTTGCPSIPYRSDEVYKYPLCYGSIESDDMNIVWNEKSSEHSDSLQIGIVFGITAFVIATILVVFFIINRRKRCLKLDECVSGDSESGNRPKEAESLLETESPKPSENVTNCHAILQHSDVLYLYGKLGNSVSTTGKEVTEEYARQHTMEKDFYNYLDIPKAFPVNKVFFIDGWCGLWNENPCEIESALNGIENIINQCNTNKNKKQKFIIGLRTEIKEKICKGEFASHEIQMTENQSYGLDNTSKEKRTVIDNKIKSLRKKDCNKNCHCRSLNRPRVMKLTKMHIGIYLFIDLLDLDHDMIPDFLDNTKGPLEAMPNHFERLLEDESVCFPLVYTVMVGYYDETEFRQDIGVSFGFTNTDETSFQNIRKYTKKIRKYQLAPMWSQRLEGNSSRSQNDSPEIYVFWHNFIYICAFHACFRMYPSETMRYCNLDAILQLVRPRRRDDKSDPFTILADDEFVDIFCEERVKNHENDSPWTEHPLIQDWKNRKAR